MFKAFTTMLVSLLGAVTVLGEGTTRFANSFNNIAKVAENTSGTYALESEIEQRIKLVELNKKLAAIEAA